VASVLRSTEIHPEMDDLLFPFYSLTCSLPPGGCGAPPWWLCALFRHQMVLSRGLVETSVPRRPGRVWNIGRPPAQERRRRGPCALAVASRSSLRFGSGNCCRTVASEAPQRASRFGAVGPLRRSWRLGGGPVQCVPRGPIPLPPRGCLVGPCGPCAGSRNDSRGAWGGLGGRAGGSLVVFKTAAPGAQLFGLLAFVGFMGLSVPRGTAAQSSPRAGPRFGVAARAPRHQHSGGRIHSHWKLLNLTVGLHPKDFCDPLRNSLAAGVPARVCRQQPESGASSDAPRPCSS